MTAPASRTAPTPAVQPRRRRRYASWRPRSALVAVVIAFAVGQAAASAVQLIAGSSPEKIDGATAVSLILFDVAMLAVIIAFARRGADRLTAATLGIRRTALGPALGWILAIYFGVIALERLYALLITGLGAGGVERQDIGSPGAPSTATAIAVFAAIAVAAPIAEEIAFRGYLVRARAGSATRVINHRRDPSWPHIPKYRRAKTQPPPRRWIVTPRRSPTPGGAPDARSRRWCSASSASRPA
jgi:membrane protease YdiL (CAAX protease family)